MTNGYRNRKVILDHEENTSCNISRIPFTMKKGGQFHGTGHVNKQQKTKSGGEDKTNILSAALWTFRRVGHGVGQANSPPENPNK